MEAGRGASVQLGHSLFPVEEAYLEVATTNRMLLNNMPALYVVCSLTCPGTSLVSHVDSLSSIVPCCNGNTANCSTVQ